MNKIFKISGVLFLIGFSVISCKKDQTTEANVISEQKDPFADDRVVMQSDLIADAKKNAVTTLALSESNFDFGKIKKGDVVEHVYEVTNTGKNPLILSSVKPGCGCTAPDYTKEPIMPGKKGKITLKFDSQNFDGLVNKYAEVYANVEQVPITINFSADIQPK